MINNGKKLKISLWENKELFDITPSIVNVEPQSTIKSGDHVPIFSKQFPSSEQGHRFKSEETMKLLKQDRIEPSNSPWSSPILSLKKQDKSLRFCIDLRRINEITIKDKYPMPITYDIFDQMSNAAYFSKIDFKSVYFEILLVKSERPKTAFSTRDGRYQFCVLPQGVSNGTPVFQRIINNILGPAKWKYTLAFLDDIIIYNNSFDQNIEHLSHILSLLRDARIRLNIEKSEFVKTKMNYLGHHIEHGIIRPNEEKIR
ncbi:unnamed protein product [Didymodactylos carnosus]|uniref:Reverse transcriptase domain-containing protein n=1 Tax=Didymodactylos carnosus TaxID=1234261 RepID=A0A815FWT9_9BILA|nr:unnamed protein product [Didymodactylos carnosus]CAF1330949.1 unnamed protein product [Didymodactylos carnosus]CAF4078572.1 unnamed protein product [Didymodactylos carnosus]CAF4184388.1 unnamed protein product [Didymodactylos carnosus]